MTAAAHAARRALRIVGLLTALVLLAGLASVPLASEAAAGPALQPSSSRPAPRPQLRAITIGTVPPVAGFPVILDGVTSVTDAAGKAHFATAEEGLTDHIELTEAVVPIDGRDVRVTASRVFYGFDGDAARLALDLSYQVQFDFVSMTGESVDASVIDAVTVKSVTGAVEELPAHATNWLQGSRVVPLSGGLEVKKLDWTVQRVQYSGSNVVNASQQKFLPAETSDVVVKLLFYRVSLNVRDAFFGFAQGRAVDVVYPDGRAHRFRLDDEGRLTLPTLPRGNYTVTAVGPGPVMTRPLAVSRDQDVSLNFYSWLDIVSAGAVVVLLALGLPMVGWRRRRVARGGTRDDEQIVKVPPAVGDEAPARYPVVPGPTPEAAHT
jgi:YD repeat-containing protein